MGRLHLTLLGGFEVRSDAGPLNLPTKKAQALLAYLALPAGQAHPRDKLASLLWGDTAEEQARASLRQALFALRKVVPSALSTTGDAVSLDPAGTRVDVAAFEQAVAAGTPEALAEAAALYQGDLLAGLAVKEAPFEEWLLGERERLRELALEGLAKLLAHQRTAGQAEAAVQTALRLLALDPLQEPVHRTLMRLYAQVGRRGTALRQYQSCVGVLQRELGIEPEPETKQLYQEILRQRPSHGAPTETITPPPASRPSPETPLIGREPEVERLRAALDGMAERRGRVLAILGEAGIGKTRLTAELAAEAAGRGARVLVGRAYESEQILPFGAWVDAFRSGDVARDPALASLEPVWRAELGRLLPEVGSPAAGAADYRQLFESVTRLLGHLAARHSLVVILEDLHWADEMTVRLLAFVGRRLDAWPILVVATGREEELPDAPALARTLEELGREERVLQLALRPLSREHTVTLVRTLARIGSDDAALSRLGEQVWRASDGNLLMAVETLRALREGAAEGEHVLPQRVREVVTRRLDRLSERAQQLAAVAAVINREFEFALLSRAAGTGEQAAAEGVEELVRRRILQGVGERFDFTHDRIREVAYRQILAPRRKLLHRRVAEALEMLYAADLDPQALALGLHYRDGEVWAKAVRYLRQAGVMAYRRAANRAAVACFEAALAALARMEESRDRIEQAMDTQLEMENALMGLGEFRRSLELLRQTESLARHLGDRARLERIFSRMTYHMGSLGDLAGAIDKGEQAMTLLAEAEDTRFLSGTNVVLARCYYGLGRYRRAIEAALRNDALAEHAGARALSRRNWSFAHGWAVLALAEVGEFAAGMARGEAAIRLARSELGPHEQVWAYLNLGRLCLVQRNLAGAIEILELGLPLCEEGGELAVYFLASHRPSARPMLCRDGWWRGCRWPSARRGRPSRWSSGFGHALAVATLGEVEMLAGCLEDARRTAERALGLAREYRQAGWEAWSLRLLGELASDDARYRAALSLATELGMRPRAGRAGRRGGALPLDGDAFLALSGGGAQARQRRSRSPKGPGAGRPWRICSSVNARRGARSSGGPGQGGTGSTTPSDRMRTWASETSGTVIVRSNASASSRCAHTGSGTTSTRRPVTRPIRRTASLSRSSSGPVTAIVWRARRPSTQGGHEDPDEVLDRHRTHALLVEADRREDGERVERVARVVEEVVALSVDDAGLHDRVVEAGGPHDLLRGPLGLVVGRAAVRAGAEEAQQDHLSNARPGGRGDHVPRSLHVHRLVRLRPDLPVDPRAVGDRVAARQGRVE